MALPDEQIQRISRNFNARGASGCPRCDSKEFSVPGTVTFTVTDAPDGDALARETLVQAVMIVCSNCGFIAHHALSAVDPEALTPPLRKRRRAN